MYPELYLFFYIYLFVCTENIDSEVRSEDVPVLSFPFGQSYNNEDNVLCKAGGSSLITGARCAGD